MLPLAVSHIPNVKLPTVDDRVRATDYVGRPSEGGGRRCLSVVEVISTDVRSERLAAQTTRGETFAEVVVLMKKSSEGCVAICPEEKGGDYSSGLVRCC